MKKGNNKKYSEITKPNFSKSYVECWENTNVLGILIAM
jgi:hypothetical protein